MATLECPKCSDRMDEGYLLDHTQHALGVSTWVSGRPEKSFWTGLRLKGRDTIPVLTYRCRRCGFLESYAYRAR
jgi:hypothetical protein